MKKGPRTCSGNRSSCNAALEDRHSQRTLQRDLSLGKLFGLYAYAKMRCLVPEKPCTSSGQEEHSSESESKLFPPEHGLDFTLCPDEGRITRNSKVFVVGNPVLTVLGDQGAAQNQHKNFEAFYPRAWIAAVMARPLYQGTTSAVPKRHFQDSGFSPCDRP